MQQSRSIDAIRAEVSQEGQQGKLIPINFETVSQLTDDCRTLLAENARLTRELSEARMHAEHLRMACRQALGAINDLEGVGPAQARHILWDAQRKTAAEALTPERAQVPGGAVPADLAEIVRRVRVIAAGPRIYENERAAMLALCDAIERGPCGYCSQAESAVERAEQDRDTARAESAMHRAQRDAAIQRAESAESGATTARLIALLTVLQPVPELLRDASEVADNADRGGLADKCLRMSRKLDALLLEAPAIPRPAPGASAAAPASLDALVNRFLAWPLPKSVCSDLCVTDRDYPHRSGTNLLTADEARQMLLYLFDGASAAGSAESARLRAQLDEVANFHAHIHQPGDAASEAACKDCFALGVIERAASALERLSAPVPREPAGAELMAAISALTSCLEVMAPVSVRRIVDEMGPELFAFVTAERERREGRDLPTLRAALIAAPASPATDTEDKP